MLERRYALATSFRRITARGLNTLEDAAPEHRERLANVHELHGFLETELPAMLQRWRDRQDRREGT